MEQENIVGVVIAITVALIITYPIIKFNLIGRLTKYLLAHPRVTGIATIIAALVVILLLFIITL